MSYIGIRSRHDILNQCVSMSTHRLRRWSNINQKTRSTSRTRRDAGRHECYVNWPMMKY